MIHSTLLLLAGFISAEPVATADTIPPARKPPSGLAARVWELTDVILDHHIDPPARQEMILGAIKSVYDLAERTPPAGLARRVSALADPAELTPLLDEVWAQLPSGTLRVHGVEIEPEDQLIGSVVESLPGSARLLSVKELKVEEQFAGNRYVGLHIAIGMDKDAKRPSIAEVMPGGPAERAGVLKGDIIEEIDGATTEHEDVRKTVDRLRGLEGTSVVIRVRQPASTEVRVLTVTRGVLPRTTVRSHSGLDKNSDALIPWGESIGYLMFTQVLASTPHELRVLARRLEEAGAKAVILDFRSVPQAHLHPTVLLADALLENGTIGRMRTTGGVETFRAEPDALFRGCPLAMLVDNDAPGTVRWLAAALQDNHRALVIGPEETKLLRPRGPRMPGTGDHNADIETAVPIGDGSAAITMATGRLERGDGRPMARAPGETKGGLVPDIITPPPAPPRVEPPKVRVRVTTPGMRTGPPVAQSPELNPSSGDDAVTIARNRLRELLKSP